MFGIANQLLAAVALCSPPRIIINSAGQNTVGVTLLPLELCFHYHSVAGMGVDHRHLLARSRKTETSMLGYINVSLTAIIMFAAVIILIDSIRRWLASANGRRASTDLGEAEGAVVSSRDPEPGRLFPFLLYPQIHRLRRFDSSTGLGVLCNLCNLCNLRTALRVSSDQV